MIPAEAEQAAAFLRGNGFDGRFACAIVLGTGLGQLADNLEAAVSVPYARIPHFPHSRVSGHAGRLTAGRLAERRILLLQGRAHYYETGDAAAMRVPVATLRALGGPPLLLTNAAGSTTPALPPGCHVVITDHISFCGANPLVGEATDARFVSMTGAYDEDLRQQMSDAAHAADVPLGEGVYMWFSGPSFETPAEVRMARTLGADLVGMSTVPEVILARYYGLRVVAVSVVTNLAAGIGGASPSHAETKARAADAAAGLSRLIRAFLSRLDDV
jgi:purine-nucleoside phosphorylase